MNKNNRTKAHLRLTLTHITYIKRYFTIFTWTQCKLPVHKTLHAYINDRLLKNWKVIVSEITLVHA